MTDTTPRFLGGSVRRLMRKLTRARRDGTLRLKLGRYTENLLYVPVDSIRRKRALSPQDRQLDLSTGFRDHRGTPLEVRCSDEDLERLASAYQAAQKDRAESCPPDLEVRGLWSEWLHLHYDRLNDALMSKDLPTLRGLLENLHRDSMSTGVGGTIDDVKLGLPWLTRAYYCSVWCNYRDLLQSVRPDWSDVASPVVGNPVGVWMDDRLIQIETLRHAHHATVILEQLSTTQNARILEIGAGIGGQAYQCLALSQGRLARYTIIDLPQVACLAGYYLLTALGSNRVRLFGEANHDSQGSIVEILPPWCIRQIAHNSVDLIYNAHSFSEMDGASALYYLREVERIQPRYFYHINHETRITYSAPDGPPSINRIGSEMRPDEGDFELMTKAPQQFRRPENRKNSGYSYLYKKRDRTTTDGPTPPRQAQSLTN